MAMRKLQAEVILIIGMAGIVTSVLATTLLTAYRQIPNAGIVKAVGVGAYEDLECTRNVTSINWGVLEPGEVANFIIYTKNEGTIALVLNMTINSWNPAQASEYITIDWNREGHVLNSKSVAKTTLTLSVSSNIEEITSFNFDIIITGIESA